MAGLGPRRKRAAVTGPGHRRARMAGLLAVALVGFVLVAAFLSVSLRGTDPSGEPPDPPSATAVPTTSPPSVTAVPTTSPPSATTLPPPTTGFVPSSDGEGAVPPTSEDPGDGIPPTQPTPDAELQGFLDDCERGVRDWRAAQVSYPATLTVRVGETASYVAGVDVRTTPEAPGSVIPGPSATGEAAFVRCEVAARLTPLGAALEVDDDDWVLRSFTPSGVIRWTWAVTAIDGTDQDLRLEMQPAVISEDGVVLVGNASTEVSSFLTRARIEEGSVQQVGNWWSANWGTVTLVAGGIGAAVLGLLKYGEQLAQRLRRVAAAWRGEPRPPDRGAPTGPPAEDAADPAPPPGGDGQS